VTLHLLSTWSLLCDGRRCDNVVVPFKFPAGLRVHSGEGINGRLWLYYMAMVSVNIVDQNVHIRENFIFSRMGDTVILHVLTIASFFLLV
jgi:hypothetical protein